MTTEVHTHHIITECGSPKKLSSGMHTKNIHGIRPKMDEYVMVDLHYS